MLDVMLVDDDSVVKRGLKELINWEELGAQVVACASDGAEAVKFLKERHIDLVISDIKMPVMNGLHLAEYIHKNQAGTKIILLSAYGEFEYAKMAVEFDVMAYLLKPISRKAINELSELVRKEAVERERYLGIKKYMHSKEFKNGIVSSVNDNDTARINGIIEIEDNYRTSDMSAVREYYLKVIDIIFEIIPPKILGSVDKADIIEKVFKTGDFESLKKYVLEKVTGIIHLKNISGTNNVSMLAEYIKYYIASNYKKSNINAESVANEFKITTTYLGYVFKKEIGIPISQYIIQLKMKEAARLLLETDLFVKDIAEAVGYNDINFFIRRFKKEYGCSPMKYKTDEKERNGE